MRDCYALSDVYGRPEAGEMTRIQRRRTRKQPFLKKCLSNRLTRGNTAPESFRATRNHVRVGRRPHTSKKIMSQLLKGSRRNNALRFTVSFSGVHVGGGLDLDDSFDYSVLAALGADGGPSLCAWSFYRPTGSSRLLENGPLHDLCGGLASRMGNHLVGCKRRRRGLLRLLRSL